MMTHDTSAPLTSGTIVFHHPAPVPVEAARGSGVRPRQMLKAFQELGYEVEEVTGFSAERHRSSQRILNDVKRGRKIDFVYGESVTTPNALSDPSHMPRHPLLDPLFFRGMRWRNVPVGVFYRDIHWLSDFYRNATSWTKRLIAQAFYRFDLVAYRHTVDILFVPSLAMVDEMPAPARRVAAVALPPGGSAVEETGAEPSIARRHGGLRLLHVGGVRPPLYDLSPVLEAVRRMPDVELTICCRREEVDSLTQLPRNCTVVHAQGAALAPLYETADLSLAVYEPHPYRRFAVPVKMFESIAHGVPLIADRNTAAGDLVERDSLGLVVGDAGELVSVLRELTTDPARVQRLGESAKSAGADHTWTARAREAAAALCAVAE